MSVHKGQGRNINLKYIHVKVDISLQLFNDFNADWNNGKVDEYNARDECRIPCNPKQQERSDCVEYQRNLLVTGWVQAVQYIDVFMNERMRDQLAASRARRGNNGEVVVLDDEE